MDAERKTQHDAFLDRMQAIEGTLHEIEQWTDPAARAAAQQIVQALLELHRGALSIIVEQLANSGDTGQNILDRCAQDELVGSVLLLHEQHPWGLERRVEHAVERLGEALNHRDGDVTLLEVSEAVIRLHVNPGSGCNSTTAIRELAERLVCDQAPEVDAIEIETSTEPSHLVQLTIEQGDDREHASSRKTSPD